MAKGLRLVRSDFDITKEMIETGELFEGFTYVEAINRLFKWFMGEEGLSFEDAVDATEDWLDENGVYYSHGTVVDKCKWCLNKNGELKSRLIKLDVVEIYENEVQMIKSLPNANLKHAYFTMMVSCKLRQQRGLEPWNKLYNGYNEYLSYSGGQISVKEEIKGLNWLQQNGYIDVPLDDLDCYYYTGVESSGEVVYKIDGTKLGRNDFKDIYSILFSEKETKYMVIDLMQESGYVIKNSKNATVKYLKEQGVNASDRNITRIIEHEKYMAGDFTVVEVQMENDLWIRGAEILQRSLQSCAKVAFKAIPSHIMRDIFIDSSINMALHEEEPTIKWCVYKKDDKQSRVSKLHKEQQNKESN